MLRSAGADVPGVLWLDDSWRLDVAEGARPRCRTAAERRRGNNATARLAALRSCSRSRLAEPAPRARPRRQADVLERAASTRGFLDVHRRRRRTTSRRFPTRAARVLVLTGTTASLAGSDTLVDLVHALRRRPNVPTVVAEVYDEHDPRRPCPQRGAVARAGARRRRRSSKDVSTVDDVELVQGRVAAVLALEQIAGGTVGHYGYGQGAQAPLPPQSVMTPHAVGRARRARDGRRDRAVARVRLRAGARDRGGARHDVPRQHVPGVELGVERAVRAARGGRAVGGARADVRHADRRAATTPRPNGSRAGCSASR